MSLPGPKRSALADGPRPIIGVSSAQGRSLILSAKTRRVSLSGAANEAAGAPTTMTKPAPRKISAIRYAPPLKTKTSPLVGFAALTATALAIALLAATIGYAQAMI